MQRDIEVSALRQLYAVKFPERAVTDGEVITLDGDFSKFPKD